ncbi:MAG: M28 family metallopeptidase [Omnitrophica WOR_2 bacterium]
MPRILTVALLLALLSSASGVQAQKAALPAAGAAVVALPMPASSSPSTAADLLSQVDLAHWSGWIRQLSGVDPVTVGGQPFTISTRYSDALFNDAAPNGRSRAFDFVREQVSGWYPAADPSAQIEEDAYQPYGSTGPTWKNLVLTIFGTEHPEQIVMLTAHLDDTSPYYERNTSAPGADDNATGSATLLEAARVLQGHPLRRTVRLIWFTGEEQGLLGSSAYVADHALTGVVGVINLDMFGYDNDNDRCFELHVGTLPASDLLGRWFAGAIHAFGINLKYDYITSGATRSSDHRSFWDKNVAALEVLENYQNNNDPAGCVGSDWNPYYHTTSDTYDRLNLPFSFDVARAALAAFFTLANPFQYIIPLVKSDS